MGGSSFTPRDGCTKCEREARNEETTHLIEVITLSGDLGRLDGMWEEVRGREGEGEGGRRRDYK